MGENGRLGERVGGGNKESSHTDRTSSTSSDLVAYT
jgi:hypothetical protein